MKLNADKKKIKKMNNNKDKSSKNSDLLNEVRIYLLINYLYFIVIKFFKRK
jgi:hypothetical protein